MSLRYQAEQMEQYENFRKGKEQGYKLALQVMEHNMQEILAFGEYGKMVHPEDLPIDYKPGMKLVEIEQVYELEKKLKHIDALISDGLMDTKSLIISIRRIVKSKSGDRLPKRNPFAP